MDVPFLASPRKSRFSPCPVSAPFLPPNIHPAPRISANSALTKLHPQLFYYGGEQLSQQRAEQQLGAQLMALQVLGWGPEGRSGSMGGAITTWKWGGSLRGP